MAVAGAPLGRSLSVTITKKDYFRSAQDKVPALTEEESEKAQLGQTRSARARFGAWKQAARRVGAMYQLISWVGDRFQDLASRFGIYMKQSGKDLLRATMHAEFYQLVNKIFKGGSNLAPKMDSAHSQIRYNGHK